MDRLGCRGKRELESLPKVLETGMDIGVEKVLSIVPADARLQEWISLRVQC
jgi:hypothetical protein